MKPQESTQLDLCVPNSPFVESAPLKRHTGDSFLTLVHLRGVTKSHWVRDPATRYPLEVLLKAHVE